MPEGNPGGYGGMEAGVRGGGLQKSFAKMKKKLLKKQADIDMQKVDTDAEFKRFTIKEKFMNAMFGGKEGQQQ